MLERELPDGLEIVDAGDVGSHRDRLVAELVRDLRRSFFVEVGHDDTCTAGREGVRAGSSDAAAGSGDDGDGL